jgi:Lsr2
MRSKPFHVLSCFSARLALQGYDLQNRVRTYPSRSSLDGSASVARQVKLTLIDDIDGSQATETVSFGLDGRRYIVDLSAAHAMQLRDALASYVAAARRGSGSTRRRPSAAPARPVSNREQTAAIRQWARANGQAVSDRGRISKVVMEAYENRDSVSAPAEAAAPAKRSRKRSKQTAG